jgi:uncharacterized membrane protein/hemerythrin-like domain-containing protein
MKSQSATEMIREDHRKVDQLYQRYNDSSEQKSDKQALREQICHELEVHAQLEEGIFYPAFQAKLGSPGKDLVGEAIKEHDEMKRLISQLRDKTTNEAKCDQTLHTMMQGVHHHVKEEESQMLPKAEQHLRSELDRIGQEMQQKKQQLTSSAQSDNRSGKGTLAQRMTATDKETSAASNIEESIDVDVPVHIAYNQWTQFEEFPKFMGGVREVTQLDNTHLHWKADIAGVAKEWDAVITEQNPDQRIAWTNTTGARNAGVVTFHRLADRKTRIMLQVAYEPEGLVENVGDMIGVVSTRVRADLERFKKFIESRGQETGAWRGEVRQTHQ